MTLCHCGRPLHYTDPDVRRICEEIVREKGEFLLVDTPGGRWRVQRHYIALHGLRAAELPKLGFERVEESE